MSFNCQLIHIALIVSSITNLILMSHNERLRNIIRENNERN
jgi:hypothetical protein